MAIYILFIVSLLAVVVAVVVELRYKAFSHLAANSLRATPARSAVVLRGLSSATGFARRRADKQPSSAKGPSEPAVAVVDVVVESAAVPSTHNDGPAAKTMANGSAWQDDAVLQIFKTDSLRQVLAAAPRELMARVNTKMSFFEDCTEASYLSSGGRAKFFRTVAQGFPELLDLLCSTDTRQTDKIKELQAELRFMSLCIISNKQHKVHLHEGLHEWFLGPMLEYLTFEASEGDRHDMGSLLTQVVPGYAITILGHDYTTGRARLRRYYIRP